MDNANTNSPISPLGENVLSAERRFAMERNLLKDQVVEFLRDRIAGGFLKPGTRLIENELAKELGASRVPVRDALSQLEGEGLVMRRAGRRVVVELTERDVQELYQLRLVLEKLSVELAIANSTQEDRAILMEKLQQMRDAVAAHDARSFSRCDFEIHQSIWQLSKNLQLQKILNSMSGLISLFVAQHAEHFEWIRTVEIHERLVRSVNSGDGQTALKQIEEHMELARQRSLELVKGGVAAAIQNGVG